MTYYFFQVFKSFIYLFICKGGSQRQRTPIHWLTLQMPTGWHWAEAESKSQELNPGFLCGWQEPGYLSHHCCSLMCALARSSSQELEAGIEAKLSDVGQRHLNCQAKCLSPKSFPNIVLDVCVVLHGMVTAYVIHLVAYLGYFTSTVLENWREQNLIEVQGDSTQCLSSLCYCCLHLRGVYVKLKLRKCWWAAHRLMEGFCLIKVLQGLKLQSFESFCILWVSPWCTLFTMEYWAF